MSLKPSLFIAMIAATAFSAQSVSSSPSLMLSGAKKTLYELNGMRIAMPVGLFLSSVDTDRNTQITRAEVLAGLAESFKASDTNKDGFLRPIEFEEWSRTYLGSTNTTLGPLQFDQDQDGRIALKEFNATFDEIQTRLDQDKDGALARSELLVEINGMGVDQAAIRSQIEGEIRDKMQGRMREMCQRARRG